MILTDLGFTHTLKKNTFTNFSYTLLSGEGSETERAQRIKSCFDSLEQKLSSELSGEPMIKSEAGEVTSTKICRGYTYKADINKMGLSLDLWASIEVHAHLSGSKVSGLSVRLHHADHDEERLLRVYDWVLKMENLRMTDDTQASKEKIELLRSYRTASHAYKLLIFGTDK